MPMTDKTALDTANLIAGLYGDDDRMKVELAATLIQLMLKHDEENAAVADLPVSNVVAAAHRLKRG